MVWWIPAAVSAAGTLMQMAGQGQAADTARYNATLSRIAGRREADLALGGAELEANFALSTAETEAALLMQGAELQAAYTRRAGERRLAAANVEAAQLEHQASVAAAVAQREALEVQRSARLAESRAIALAAASGGGVSGTVHTIVGNIAKEGAYQAAAAAWVGDERARVLKLQAAVRRTEGAWAEQAAEEEATMIDYRGKASAAATLFRGRTAAVMSRYRGAATAEMANLRGESGFFNSEAQARAYTSAQTGTLISGGANAFSLYKKYGGKGPPMVGGVDFPDFGGVFGNA